MTDSPKQIYLSPPHMSGHEMAFVEEAFATNWIAPCGPNQEAFEQEMADYIGARGAVAVSSGTAAIHLALRLCGVGPGDVVLCSSLTFIGSATPILFLGAIPVFIDSEPESWNMSPSALERAFKESESAGTLPKAVIVVNLYGQCADYDSLKEICDRYEVPLIEDAAESLGATYKGKASGMLGKYGIFSFNGNKIITTSGGGMLVSDDLEALAKARYWATQARDPALHYEHSELGYNYRMSNVLAGIGRGQLKVLADRVQRRRSIFDRYYEALHDIEGIEFMPESSYGNANRWLTVLTLGENCKARPLQIIQRLDDNDIEARPVWKPLHLQPVFQGHNYYPHEPRNSFSDQVFQTGLCLPSGSNLEKEDQHIIIQIIQNALT
ncbi:MAG: aminotransferase class I/II-fold pyridoxal phosphate-dependent enzyme [Nitrospinota bacterium]|nr:aminotransferase class I/II-fold pyridoxal phosphate-dependent enzyme [Nitrospinota bacterium]